jgi:N-acetylglucosaminyl-diphospho-decaprenol L-rhamnosyltransferase
MSGDIRVSVVVLNYRTPELTVECARSALAEIDPAQDCVVVVDNASGDGSADKIRAGLAGAGAGSALRVIESVANGGFAAGNNLGIANVAARAYLLLNSDTWLRPGAIERLWQVLESDDRVGIVTPRLEWPDGRPQISCFRFHSPFSELIAGASTGPVRALLDAWDVPLPVTDGPSEPDWSSFAAVMIRADVIRAVGPLDSAFFMYFEDVEYCRRVRRAGWRIRNEPSARVVHLRGGSSPVKALSAARKRRPRYYYASRARYYRRAYGPAGPLAANLLWTAGRSLSWLRETLTGKPPHTVERELFDNWRG